jgi:hypothetical protein
MKLLMLIYSGPNLPRISSLLDAHEAGGYTELRDVHGTGPTGRLLGTRAWPGSAAIVLSIVPATQVQALTDALKAYKEKAAVGEHLHVAVMPVEAYL